MEMEIYLKEASSGDSDELQKSETCKVQRQDTNKYEDPALCNGRAVTLWVSYGKELSPNESENEQE